MRIVTTIRNFHIKIKKLQGDKKQKVTKKKRLNVILRLNVINKMVKCDFCGKDTIIKHKWFNFVLAEEYKLCDECFKKIQGGNF